MTYYTYYNYDRSPLLHMHLSIRAYQLHFAFQRSLELLLSNDRSNIYRAAVSTLHILYSFQYFSGLAYRTAKFRIYPGKKNVYVCIRIRSSRELRMPQQMCLDLRSRVILSVCPHTFVRIIRPVSAFYGIWQVFACAKFQVCKGTQIQSLAYLGWVNVNNCAMKRPILFNLHIQMYVCI